MMLFARIQDALDIWNQGEGQFPQSSPAQGRWGFWLRVKASICIALGREAPYSDYNLELVPVWVGPLCVRQTSGGPTADWAEVAVDHRNSIWRYSRYTNGI